MTDEQLPGDRKTREAIILNFVVIGEAIKKIPQGVVDRYPDVPWKEFAGMRDKMVHGYFQIGPMIVWGDKPARSGTACGCREGAASGRCLNRLLICRPNLIPFLKTGQNAGLQEHYSDPALF